MNLQNFVNYWDDFVKNWLDNHQNSSISLLPESQQFVNLTYSGAKAFYPDELVEPYLGDPLTCEFVIINYNPGGCQNGKYTYQGKESNKYYSNLKKPDSDGWLIDQFVNTHKGVYSSFLNNWSALNSGLVGNKPPVCGVSWWQGKGGNGGRMKWMKSFAQNFGIKNLSSDKVFALEMAPYHSALKGPFVLEPSLQGHYLDKIIEPAGFASQKTSLKMAICVGEDFNQFLLNIRAVQLKVWSNTTNTIQRWPSSNKTNKYSNRKYVLWQYKLSDGSDAYYLVLSHNGANHLPSNRFLKVDQDIANDCKNHINNGNNVSGYSKTPTL